VKQKLKVQHRPKKWLTEDDTVRLLVTAKEKSTRDWLILELCRASLRIGEILGTSPRTSFVRWNKHPEGRAYKVRGLAGIQVDDITDYGIYLQGKGYVRAGKEHAPDRIELLPWLVKELRDYSARKGRGKNEKLFQGVNEWKFERLIKKYAKAANIEGYQFVSPHRLRAFYATQAKDKNVNPYKIKEKMRHANLSTTERYIGPMTARESHEITELLGQPLV